MAKKCIFLDYTLHVYLENVVCSSGQDTAPNTVICAPRNVRLIAQGENDDTLNNIYGDPQRLTLTSPHLLHVMLDSQNIPSACIGVNIQRTIECGNGCTPGYYSVPMKFFGSGMMLPPGEYTFSVPDQVAYGACPEDIDQDYPLTLLFEPVGTDVLNTALYNATCGF